MSAGPGTSWLRRMAEQYRHLQEERGVSLSLKDSDTRRGERFEHAELGTGTRTRAILEREGGHIRIGRSSLGEGQRSKGLVPWYVPEGADFDMTLENSTKTLAWGGEYPWAALTIEEKLEIEEALRPYHLKVDWMQQHEAEDWDIPCCRPPQPHPSFDSSVETTAEQRAAALAALQDLAYEELMSRTPDIDDDYRESA